MSLSPHIENKVKDILILVKDPTQELGEHSLSAEKMYLISFTKVNTKFCLSLHYNRANSYLFVNGPEIHKFTGKDSEIVPNNLCFGNVLKDFSASNLKKTGFNGHIYDLSLDYTSLRLKRSKVFQLICVLFGVLNPKITSAFFGQVKILRYD